MKKTHSREYPVKQRLQGQWLVPASIQPTTDCDGGTGYSYVLCRFDADAPDLQYQAEKQVLKQTYAEVLELGCPIDSLGLRIDCKPKNCADFAQSLVVWNLAYAENPNAEVVVRDYVNDNHTITFAEFQVLCQELGAHVARLRQDRWAAIDALEVVQ
ncbi:MAG: hypothetical protein QM498_05380 [Desulfobacterium sp.]